MTWTSIIAFITKYKKIILAIAASIGLLLLITYGIMVIENLSYQSKVEKARAEVNAQLQDAVNINANIANLQIKEVEAKANVNAAVANLDQAQKEVTNAEENSNKSGNNVNIILNHNYNGTSTDDAERKRCQTFPDSFGC